MAFARKRRPRAVRDVTPSLRKAKRRSNHGMKACAFVAPDGRVAAFAAPRDDGAAALAATLEPDERGPPVRGDGLLSLRKAFPARDRL